MSFNNYFSIALLVIAISIFLISKCIRIYKYYSPDRFPPGPIKYPIIGSLIPWRKSPLEAMTIWKQRYGKLVGLRLGSWRVVIINDYEWIKEAFNQKAFNGRPDFKPAMLFTGGYEHGTLTSEGDAWDIIRRFTIKNLKTLGFGRKTMALMLKNDISNLIDHFRKVSNKPVSLHGVFYIPAVNHLWTILCGQEMPADQVQHIQDTIVHLNEKLWQPIGNAIWMMPWLSDIFPVQTGLTDLKKAIEQFRQILGNRLAQLEVEDVSAEGAPKHLVDAFLREIYKAKDDPKSQFHKEHGYAHLEGMVNNLFITAAESINNTMNWVILYLALNSAVQEKLWVEIMKVVGGTRMPSLDDQHQMPYTKAVMLETFRIATTSPFSNFQYTTSPVEFKGYHIPVDTIIIANLFGLHHNETLWDQPESFRPERFLEVKDETSLPPLIPFSVGLRTCLGQSLVKVLFSLMLTALVQQFRFEWDNSVPKPTEQELMRSSRVSVFRFCPNFNIILRDRRCT